MNPALQELHRQLLWHAGMALQKAVQANMETGGGELACRKLSIEDACGKWEVMSHQLARYVESSRALARGAQCLTGQSQHSGLLRRGAVRGHWLALGRSLLRPAAGAWGTAGGRGVGAWSGAAGKYLCRQGDPPGAVARAPFLT